VPLPEVLWPEVLWPELLLPHWLLPEVEPCEVPWFELVVLESPAELIEPLLLPVLAVALVPDVPMLPLAVAPLSLVLALPLAVALGFDAAVPAVDWVPSTEPCWVVPVLLAVFVSLFELEHAAINAAAAIAVPT